MSYFSYLTAPISYISSYFYPTTSSTLTTDPFGPMQRNFDRIITQEELKVADLQQSDNLWVALYVAEIDGNPVNKICVFDVSSGKDFYGPGCGYSIFAAKDASRALATMNLKETNTNIDDLNEQQTKTLNDWAAKYLTKYPIVGILA